MQLPDEALSFQYQSVLRQPRPDEEWTPQVELQSQHFLSPQRLRDFQQRINQVRAQVATERETAKPGPAQLPLDSAFIDLPDRLLIELRRSPQTCELTRIQQAAQRLRELADRVIILGSGGSSLGAQALREAMLSTCHNELPGEQRIGTPRIYFEGDSLDNDALQELLELLQTVCVNPDVREERWGAIVVSKSGKSLETAAALRAFRREAAEYYGSKSPWLRQLIVPVTGESDSQLRALMQADGYRDEEIFVVPERVGGRCSVFSAAGLIPAAVMGLDVRALLMGAASMTRQFIDEPFERNAVLQLAAVCHLMSEEQSKPIRVLAVWSKKLAGLARWYEQLVAESLGKQGLGPTPIACVCPRDLHSRGQQLQEGRRDKLILNVVVKQPRSAPIPIGMADRNEDDLNSLSRKTYPDLLEAARRGAEEAYFDAARPQATISLPVLNEYTLGQMMQMFMLATIVEGRLLGVNPYGQPGVEAYRRNMQRLLKAAPTALAAGRSSGNPH